MFYLIDKPKGISSSQALRKFMFLNGIKKAGHSGTLDPFATGLLIICTGQYTKMIDDFQGQSKRYSGTFTLGATTPSYDLETEIDEKFPTVHITKKLLLEIPQMDRLWASI